jgi:type II secretory pathway component PulF
VTHHVPLNEALPLAAEASGVESMSLAARELGNQIAAGSSLSANPEAFRQLPPLVRLALIEDRGPDSLATVLHQAAGVYQSRAQLFANRVGFYFPLLITALVGGTVVGLYAFLLLQPYAASLREIARWS